MSSRRGGLGRGLESLIPTDGGSARFVEVPVDEIAANPQQPRTTFDDEALDVLAQSIATLGVLQPILVRETEGAYVLVAGERRLRAAKRAGLVTIPAVVGSVDDDGDSLVRALVENLQREDLSPLEEAAAYQQMVDEFEMTHAAIAERVGRSRSAVSNSLRLLTLSPALQAMVEAGDLSAGHARALLGTDDHAFAEHIARRAVDEGWSVRQVEEAVRVREREGDRDGKGGRPAVREVRPVEIIELEQRLTDQLDTKVKIAYRGKSGSLTIRFGSLDDLERLYRRFFSA